MTNKQVRRVIYPLGNAPITEAEIRRNAELDKQNLWGERCYFYNCHRDGGDFDWLTNNLSLATNSPAPEQITAAWTFAGKWDPENKSGPTVQRVKAEGGFISLTFNESVTVKRKPRLRLRDGSFADYVSGSGTDTLDFRAAGEVKEFSLDLNGGAIIASEAAAVGREFTDSHVVKIVR